MSFVVLSSTNFKLNRALRYGAKNPVNLAKPFKYNQQDATLYNILYYVNALHVSGGFSTNHQELKNCLLLPLAVAGSKLGIYPMLYVQFLSS